MRKALLSLSAAALLLSSAAVTAQYPARQIDPRLVAEAQREHSELVQEYGGADSTHRATYVDSVGRRVAYHSGVANPGGAYRFTLLNSAVENAFAQAGGYVYLTRQLMALMDDESQLAFALGHEVGHIAANHAQARQSVSSRNTIMGVLGAVLAGEEVEHLLVLRVAHADAVDAGSEVVVAGDEVDELAGVDDPGGGLAVRAAFRQRGDTDLPADLAVCRVHQRPRIGPVPHEGGLSVLKGESGLLLLPGERRQRTQQHRRQHDSAAVAPNHLVRE